MQDLTRGSVTGHILAMAGPIAAGMLFQTLYYFIDLYFVAQLGDAAIAGVSTAGNVTFLVIALTQVLAVGTTALIAHAVGRKDRADANIIFNQSLLLAAICAALTLIASYTLSHAYVNSVAADPAIVAEGVTYLYWYAPGLGLQFALVAMSSALRGTGIVKPAMTVQVLTVVLNALFAPVLIAGWGTGYPLGVAGAGLASSLAIAIGVGVLWIYFQRREKFVAFHPEQWQPRLAVWKRMLTIGLPAGGEFGLIFVYTAITYWAIRQFGAEAQAGFGIGARIMQGIFLPAMAIAFAAAPVAGQNFGARHSQRVRDTFRRAAILEVSLMAALMLLCQWQAETLVRIFTSEAETVRIGTLFLQILSWNFVTQGVIFTCSSLFQALGNTVPSLASSATRLATYIPAVVWLSTQPNFRIEYVWYLSVATTGIQTLVSLLLLRMEMRDRLADLSPPATANVEASA